MAGAASESQGDFHLARAALGAYGDRVRTVKTHQVAPGVRAFPTPGHTPGHTAWVVESKGEGLLIWGDIVHFPGIGSPSPMRASPTTSVRPPPRRRERQCSNSLRERNCASPASISTSPTFGHVVPSGPAYRFVPEVWRPTI